MYKSLGFKGLTGLPKRYILNSDLSPLSVNTDYFIHIRRNGRVTDRVFKLDFCHNSNVVLKAYVCPSTSITPFTNQCMLIKYTLTVINKQQIQIDVKYSHQKGTAQ